MNRWILLVALVLVQVNTYAEDEFGFESTARCDCN